MPECPRHPEVVPRHLHPQSRTCAIALVSMAASVLLMLTRLPVSLYVVPESVDPTVTSQPPFNLSAIITLSRLYADPGDSSQGDMMSLSASSPDTCSAGPKDF